MSPLLKFLARNSIDKSKTLPLVHTCEAYFLKHIFQDKCIRTHPCDVFIGENLLYTFVGRPAYKKEISLEPEYWELPACLILEYDLHGSKYVFPFDTGAFDKNKYPSFVNMMKMMDYDVSSDPEAVQKLIGSFFIDPINYYRTKARDLSEFINRYSVDVLDEEIKALHTLVTTRMPRTPDDRRASIEVSFDTELSLANRKVLAVVFPEIYLQSDAFMSYVEDELKATPISYPIYTQNVNFYFSCIYLLVEQFYRQKRFFHV